MDPRPGESRVAALTRSVEASGRRFLIDLRTLGAKLHGLAKRRQTRFRVGVTAALVALVSIVAFQSLRTQDLERQLMHEQGRVADLADGLRRMQSQALTRDEIVSLRSEVRQGFVDAGERVRTLEARSNAVTQVIANASGSVAFIQGSYGLRDPATKRLLSFAMLDGLLLRQPDGRPQITLGGSGPPLEIQFTGTAFVVGPGGVLLTNRHVALPWEDEMSLPSIRRLGLEPALVRVRGYLPGAPEAFDVKLLAASDTHDLALLQGDGAARNALPLRLSAELPAPGEAAILLGFPAGIRALMVRAGETFASELRQRPDVDDDVVGRELARAGLIRPLAARGIVAQVSGEAVVYDAQTGSGGSGGPVLDSKGEVVAINRAILAGFGGSNIGVPARHAITLLGQLRKSVSDQAVGTDR